MNSLCFREWLAEDNKRNGATLSLPSNGKHAKKMELKDRILKAKDDKELAAVVDEILALGLRLSPRKNRADLRRWLMENKLLCLQLLSS
jgi:hypothetical protein